MNMFARFDENPVMALQDIKETKRYGSWSAHAGTIYAFTKALLGKNCLSSHGCHFVKNYFFLTKLLYAYVQCVYIV